MNSKSTILATKQLTSDQKELLLNAGIEIVAYDAIQIELLEVEVEGEIQNAIFTSKNAVRTVFNDKSSLPLFHEAKVFCVGENTRKLLEEKGLNVIEIAQSASDLAGIISKKYKNESFLFFCGNLRRDDLPVILNENKVKLREQIVYKTHLKQNSFDRSFGGVLFFSPSGVQSYVSENNMRDSVAFCIGNTTASEAKKYTDNIIVADKPTVENVIVQAVKYFK